MHSLEIQFRNLSAQDARGAVLWMSPQSTWATTKLEKTKEKNNSCRYREKGFWDNDFSLYRVVQKRRHCIADGNFVNCWKIFNFFSLLESWFNLLQDACNIFHHTFKVLPLYLAKCEPWQKLQNDYTLKINQTVKLVKLFEKMFNVSSIVLAASRRCFHSSMLFLMKVWEIVPLNQ